jgi:hypothetical protein
MREWDRAAVTALHAAVYINDGSVVEVIRDRLAIAISGKGAFRRFKDVLSAGRRRRRSARSGPNCWA